MQQPTLNSEITNMLLILREQIKINLQRDGHLTPVAFLKIGNSVILPEHFMFEVQGKTFQAFNSVQENYQILVLPLAMESEENKFLSLAILQGIITSHKADFMILITEGWSVVKSLEETLQDSEKAFLIPPRLDPERQEIILVCVQNSQGVWESITPLKRDQCGIPIIPNELGKLTFNENPMGNFCFDFR